MEYELMSIQSMHAMIPFFLCLVGLPQVISRRFSSVYVRRLSRPYLQPSLDKVYLCCIYTAHKRVLGPFSANVRLCRDNGALSM